MNGLRNMMNSSRSCTGLQLSPDLNPIEHLCDVHVNKLVPWQLYLATYSTGLKGSATYVLVPDRAESTPE